MNFLRLLGIVIPGSLVLGALAKHRSSAPNQDEQLAERLRERTQDAPDWHMGRLTEFHPDAPAEYRKLEGGQYDRGSNRKRGLLHPVITVEQHRADPQHFPFVTVAADTELQGHRLQPSFGPRLYLRDFPDLVFRIYDTGGHFYGSDKKIREAGHEPFDIATSWRGAWRGRFSGKLTGYRIDWADILPYPSELVIRVPPQPERA